jgi:hypothetical protein
MPEHATVRRRVAPPQPRRVSGPSRPRLVPAGAATRAGGTASTGAFERLRALPDTKAVDRLLRSRACIWLIGVMLAGIVAMQVSLLRMNTAISRAVETQSTLVRENASLEAAIATKTAGDKIRATALKDDMVDPPAGEGRFLVARPGPDPWLAARRMKPPSDEARQVMQDGGRLPGVAAVGAAAPIAGAEGAGASIPGTTTATQATATLAATPTATPVATATPLATATPVATATVAPTVTAVPTAVPQG